MDSILPTSRPVPTPTSVRGRLRVPASKSVSQRYLNLALLSRRATTLHHLLFSEDIEHYLDALSALGFGVERDAESVHLGAGRLRPEADLFCGAGGTMMRFLSAALCTVPGTWRLDGIARLRERPLAPLLATLRDLGADITCLQREGYPPLRIRGRGLAAGRARLDAGLSSQYLSALLMAGQKAEGPIELEIEGLTSAPYVALTLEAIRRFGGRVDASRKEEVRIFPSALEGGELTVEGDDSAAAYPAAAAALCGGDVVLEGLRIDSQQGDRGFIALLETMGARASWEDGRLRIEGKTLSAVEADLSQMPDQVPTLAALAPFARGTTRILNVPHLRHKESDRLSAMAQELTRLGASVVEKPDGLIIPGVWNEAPPPATPVEVDSHGDHRIAMSLALVGLRRPGVVVRDPGVVGKSYPRFWDDLESLLQRE